MCTLICLWAFHSISLICLQIPEPGPYFHSVTIYFISVIAKHSYVSFLFECFLVYSHLLIIPSELQNYFCQNPLIPLFFFKSPSTVLTNRLPFKSLVPHHLKCGNQIRIMTWKGWCRLQIFHGAVDLYNL